MLSAATAVAAEPPSRAQVFASQVKEWQALVGSTASTFKPAPTFRAQLDAPLEQQSFGDRFASLQAIASNSWGYNMPPIVDARAADPIGRPRFVERFAQLQVLASNSDAFCQRPESPSNPATSVAGAGDGPASTLARKWADLLRRSVSTPPRFGSQRAAGNAAVHSDRRARRGRVASLTVVLADDSVNWRCGTRERNARPATT